MENLAVIIPIFNEEEIVESVISNLVYELTKLKIDYKIFAYNDGSKDNSAKILEKLANNNPNIIVINKPNAGHGPTILRGYKENAAKFSWIFQIDADNEMEPEYFSKLWGKRFDYDLLIPIRYNRVQNVSRKIVSFISRLCVRVFYGNTGPWDVNSPFRLIRSEKFIDLFNKLPDNVYSPNLLVSGITAKKTFKFFEYKIPCKQRQTGEVSLKKMKLIKTSLISLWQTIIFSFLV